MPCSAPRQYVVTLPSSGAVTALLYNRTDSGTPDTTESQGKNWLSVVIPTTKQGGTENPATGRVALFWTDSSETPEVADLISLGEFGRGSIAEIPLGDLKGGLNWLGYFWAVALGGTAIEVHCTETKG